MTEHPIEFEFPDITPWRAGNAGTEFVHVLESTEPGPVVMVNALTHGNEVSGAIVVDALLRHGLKPRRGTLILSFANVAAYFSFDKDRPFKSRMVDEDFNRVWSRLDQPGDSVELGRARQLRPFVERADLLLDLHSMHDDCVPLMLAGPLQKGVDLARRVGTPIDIIRDKGHPSGRRMRDHGGFGDPDSPKVALLIETGQHWRAASVAVAKDVTARFLVLTGAAEPADLPADWQQKLPPAQRVVEVTHAVATRQGNFTFVKRHNGQDIVAKAGTVLGHDDDTPIVTPYDNCVLVMPSNHRVRAGVTIVRMGRVV
ncbi:succinylglutamate desuccinylase/aspartoacylase domain-containing protein [Vineibacter terrae]|uniref:succinylglutamate desuccinylase/aspartoacylase domain-containing protein n=1 Tax=Vineibacter terrae TaxID=2586908 RepID=UPI002E3160FD|nr:succinylglutamate desuccinylase/aspartoacylase family protein [Vineibacter terrae]HEX2885135.1 succinylglutamate desuccinylase/aspartoacylase family protein [Vineibacter terrae]